MCGIAGIFGYGWKRSWLEAMVAIQHHRGPDGSGIYIDSNGLAGLGHNRLSIIDLSNAGHQPMASNSGRFKITFNGEIYNYLELRRELRAEYEFRTQTDTEVLLAAYQTWGAECLDRLIGMFAFAIWDEATHTLFAARDRFGVKPLYYNFAPDGTLKLASELKALLAAGAPSEPDLSTWAKYFAHGLYDNNSSTFLKDLHALPPGHSMVWRDGELTLTQWYDLAKRVGQEFDERSEQQISEEYMALLEESVRLRFRSDVPVGINLSGGLDSSTLLGLVQKFQGEESGVKAFTFVTGDPRYDELPWVTQMLSKTNHPLIPCLLSSDEVPALAESVQVHQDEPFGGLPTLAYARLFETARNEGTIVLLDGQGMDEQWAGYDYYTNAATGQPASVVQGSLNRPVRPDCLTPEFLAMTGNTEQPQRFPDELRNLQYRDTRYTKIPRALRFNDRISMRASTELREPFLDHRLFELAFRQKSDLKIRQGTGKWMLRNITKALLPQSLAEAPKRPVQTPQREWLRGPLKSWASDLLDEAISGAGADWLNADATRRAWREFCAGESDNSFYVWQWISLGLMSARRTTEICLN